MANWIITSPDLQFYAVRVGDCDRAHAESVFHSLLADPAHPNLLDLTEVDDQWKTKRVWFRKVLEAVTP